MSWYGAMSGALTGAQIGGLGGAFAGGILGAVLTGRTAAEKGVADFYAQLSKGVSRKEAEQRKSIAEQKVDAKEAERRATQVARGGVSSAGGGVSGVAMQAGLQSEALAQKTRAEAIGNLQKALADQDIQMQVAGAQGTAAFEAQRRLDQEKGLGYLTDYDWGQLGKEKAPPGDPSLIVGEPKPPPTTLVG